MDFQKPITFLITKHKKQVIIIILIASILALSMLAYVLGSYYIKSQGITLKPSKDHDVKEAIHYLQNDPAWSKQTIGYSGSTMGSAGCLLTSVAGAITDLGTPITPGELNEKLTAVNGFYGADLIWYKIKEAVPKVDYSYSRIFSSLTIERDLNQGLLPIVKVKYFKTGVTHWVLVAGAKDGEFLILDPANSGAEPIPLSTHGKVFAYRVIKNII